MQFHTIKKLSKSRKKKRIGRGGKRGSFSGRGIKGQKSRSGRKIRPALRDVIKKLPKKRGYKIYRFSQKPYALNIGYLEKFFSENEMVTPASLLKKGLIKKEKGRLPQVKILGSGAITKRLSVSSCRISKSAEDKIKKAGGEIK